MEQEPPKKTVFPDKEKIAVEEAIASKKWHNCPKCTWFYNQAVLTHCPMCRYEWALGSAYEQPPYEPTTIG